MITLQSWGISFHSTNMGFRIRRRRQLSCHIHPLVSSAITVSFVLPLSSPCSLVSLSPFFRSRFRSMVFGHRTSTRSLRFIAIANYSDILTNQYLWHLSHSPTLSQCPIYTAFQSTKCPQNTAWLSTNYGAWRTRTRRVRRRGTKAEQNFALPRTTLAKIRWFLPLDGLQVILYP